MAWTVLGWPQFGQTEEELFLALRVALFLPCLWVDQRLFGNGVILEN